MCFSEPETVEHVMRDCPAAQLLWNHARFPLSFNITFQLSFDDWLILKNNSLVWNGTKRDLAFAAILWMHWKWRCNALFQPGFQRPNHAIEVIIAFVKSWEAANARTQALLPTCSLTITWLPPLAGCVRFNVDGSCYSDNSLAAGGVLRDYQGNWLVGFEKKISIGTIRCAEFWGV